MAYCSNLPGEASLSPHPGCAGPAAAGEGDLQHEQPGSSSSRGSSASEHLPCTPSCGGVSTSPRPGGAGSLAAGGGDLQCDQPVSSHSRSSSSPEHPPCTSGSNGAPQQQPLQHRQHDGAGDDGSCGEWQSQRQSQEACVEPVAVLPPAGQHHVAQRSVRNGLSCVLFLDQRDFAVLRTVARSCLRHVGGSSRRGGDG
eukprot:7088160-Alexandrium_andersonii.AAC.1